MFAGAVAAFDVDSVCAFFDADNVFVDGDADGDVIDGGGAWVYTRPDSLLRVSATTPSTKPPCHRMNLGQLCETIKGFSVACKHPM